MSRAALPSNHHNHSNNIRPRDEGDDNHHAANNSNNHDAPQHRRRRVAEAHQRFTPSAGARLVYTELGPAQPRPPETFRPTIQAGVVAPAHARIMVGGGNNNSRGQQEAPPPIWLMRKHDPQQAYALLENKKEIKRDHHVQGWSRIVFGVLYPRYRNSDDNNDSRNPSFTIPNAVQARYVAIKELNKALVQKYLNAGGSENPFVEIARMQELGDDEHVLSCMEALETATHLYIVMPRGQQTLMDVIPYYSSTLLPPERIHELFVQVLRILVYLEQHHICHRDLSPDNFLFITPERLVVFDLAKSHRIPVIVDDDMHHGVMVPRRCKLEPMGVFGTPPCLAPELYRDRVFDGVATDLWAAVLILYNMCTNEMLYQLAYPSDVSFRYWIWARQLNSVRANEQVVERLLQHHDDDHEAPQNVHVLQRQAMAHLRVPPAAMAILAGVLQVNAAQRWTLAQVLESDYVRHGATALDDD